MQYNFFLVAGFGWSGSSAVVDLLKEYKATVEPDVEFRLIKDPYGINDLYESLVLKGDQLNNDTAIKDFLWFANKLYYQPVRFDLNAGLGYREFFGERFMECTHNFINSIVDFQYSYYWWMFDFKKSRKEIFKQKVNSRLFKREKTQNSYFSAVEEEDFVSNTRTYMKALFDEYAEHNQVEHIVLDQAVSVMKYDQEMRFIPDSKLIVVDRDPRDIYTDLCEGNFLIGAELSKTRNAMDYVKWHKAWRRKIDSYGRRENVLVISFEELVNDYEHIVSEIEAFLDLSPEQHIRKKELFDPSVSKKNIGIWKRYMNEEELRVMEEELGTFFYEK